MKERVVEFGPKGSLQGVVTLPETLSPGRPAFIFLNSGLLHRIGPFRLYVALARALARMGFVALRMDLSGKGDSLPRRNGKSLHENVLEDVQDAINYLEQQYSIEGAVLCGICTGADNTYQCAMRDERIVGIVPIDGYAYRTAGYYVRYYAPKLLELERWVSFTLGWLRRIREGSARALGAAEEVTVDYRMLFPPRKVFRKDLQMLLDRGVRVLVVYSGGWAVNYEGQFAAAFPRQAKHEHLELEFNPRADHTYSISMDKDRLIGRMCDWAEETFTR